MRHFWLAACVLVPLLPGLALAQNSAPPPPGPMAGPGMGDDGHGGWGMGHHFMDPGALLMQFYAANTTHDGHLTLIQAKAAGLTPVAAHFADIDAKKRGYVTFYDIEAWHLDNIAQRLQARADALRAQDQ